TSSGRQSRPGEWRQSLLVLALGAPTPLGWRCFVEGEQLAIDDQTLGLQSREVGPRRDCWMLARRGHEVRDHHEAWLNGLVRKVPHRPAEHVLEAADDVV